MKQTKLETPPTLKKKSVCGVNPISGRWSREGWERGKLLSQSLRLQNDRMLTLRPYLCAREAGASADLGRLVAPSCVCDVTGPRSGAGGGVSLWSWCRLYCIVNWEERSWGGAWGERGRGKEGEGAGGAAYSTYSLYKGVLPAGEGEANLTHQ